MYDSYFLLDERKNLDKTLTCHWECRHLCGLYKYFIQMSQFKVQSAINVRMFVDITCAYIMFI